MLKRFSIALLFVLSIGLMAPNASRLCPTSLGGCLGSDTTDLCVDSNRNGVFCEDGEKNLTKNAPTNTAGDETVQGDLAVTGDLSVVGSVSAKTVRSVTAFMTSAASINFWTPGSGGPCWMTNSGATNCTSDLPNYKTRSVVGIFDAPVTVLSITCAHDFIGTWDSGDSISWCVRELGATNACVGGSVTIADTTGDGNSVTAVVNATTANTTDFALTIARSASTDATDGSETFVAICTITYTQ